jgi:hypothetical protein
MGSIGGGSRTPGNRFWRPVHFHKLADIRIARKRRSRPDRFPDGRLPVTHDERYVMVGSLRRPEALFLASTGLSSYRATDTRQRARRPDPAAACLALACSSRCSPSLGAYSCSRTDARESILINCRPHCGGEVLGGLTELLQFGLVDVGSEHDADTGLAAGDDRDEHRGAVVALFLQFT